MEVENSGNDNFRVSFCRDFPPGCGIWSSSFNGFSDTSTIHDFSRDFPTGFVVDSPKKAKKIPEKAPESELRSSCNDWRRNVTAVRSEPIKGDDVGKRKPVVSSNAGKEIKDSGERSEVLGMVELFRKRCDEIARSGRGIRRIDTTAYTELKKEGKLEVRSAYRVGDVPGVEVGDKFHYRVELAIVGLHKVFQSGIDSMEWKGGRIATSIVANERHSDKLSDPNSLVYIGEGGMLKRNQGGVPPDQELKGGNKALWSSMEEKKPIRVIRGITSERNAAKLLYVYDGLYEIRGCERKKGSLGNKIFEFQMTRLPGQAAVPWQSCRWYQF